MTEIRSVFDGKMSGDANFPFTILQAIGGGSKSLAVPNTSSSFTWTAKELTRPILLVGVPPISGQRLTLICNTEEDNFSPEWM